MTPEQALARLLAGTGLVFSISGGTTVTLQKPGAGVAPGAIQLDPVQVQGYPVPPQAMIDNIPPPYAGGQVATGGQLGLLGNRAVMDTPFNQTSYTAKKVQDQQAQDRARRADRRSVGARIAAADGIAGDNVYYPRLRGRQQRTRPIGGLYGMLPTYSIMAELAERVEVLKGPSAMLNGMQPCGAIGGTINVVPKRAPDEPLTQFTANYVSAGAVRRPCRRRPALRRRQAVRRALQRRVPGRRRSDVQWNTEQRRSPPLGLDFRGERVRAGGRSRLSVPDTSTASTPYLGVATGVPLPWAPNVRNNAGGQPWSYVAAQGPVRRRARRGRHDGEHHRLRGLRRARQPLSAICSAGSFLTATNFARRRDA